MALVEAVIAKVCCHYSAVAMPVHFKVLLTIDFLLQRTDFTDSGQLSRMQGG